MEQGTSISIFHHQRGLLTEGVGDSKQSILEFWRKTYITIYVMKLHGARDLGKNISYPKGISLMKVQEITSHHS